MCLAVCHGHMTNITKTINESIPNEKVDVCVLFCQKRAVDLSGTRVLSGQDMKANV